MMYKLMNKNESKTSLSVKVNNFGIFHLLIF